MKAISLKAADIFNMSFGQVFVAGQLEGTDELVRPGRWKLFVNDEEVGELDAVGEQLPKGAPAGQRVVAYQGRIDTTSLDLRQDKVVLIRVD
jgi:hypothetical protein